MKITCHKCSAIYRIPEEKLTKEVSRATCKKCGEKLIIKRPGAGEDGFEDLRLSSGLGSDEESVINHEERTVIAQVPELQKFDATPVLSTSAASAQEELRNLLTGPASHAAPAPSRAPQEEPRKISAALKVAVSAQKPAPAPVPVGPSITATTSPIPPSGNAPTAHPQAALPAPPPATPASTTPSRANVVDIFSRPGNAPAASAPEFHQPTSKLPMILQGIALLGVLAFVDHGLWGLTRLTAIGFFVALYCILAAFLTHMDLATGGRINFAKVMLIPAVICAALLAILLKVQGREIAFMHPEVDVVLITQYIESLPNAPPAEIAGDQDIGQRVAAAVKRGQIRTPRNTDPGEAEFDPSRLTRPGAVGPDGKTLEGGEVGGLATTGIGGLNSGWVPSAERRKLPGAENLTTAKATVDLDTEGIDQAIEGSRAVRCFTTDAQGQEIPGRVELNVQMKPDGTPVQVRLMTESLRGSQLEECIRSKIKLARLPPFEGESLQSYTYTFIF